LYLCPRKEVKQSLPRERKKFYESHPEDEVKTKCRRSEEQAYFSAYSQLLPNTQKIEKNAVLHQCYTNQSKLLNEPPQRFFPYFRALHLKKRQNALDADARSKVSF
jgi:hypothetical protein